MNSFRLSSKTFILYFILVAISIFIVCIHLYLLIPGLDAGLHMYGALLITKGYLPYADLWNNKPPLIYIIGALGFLLKSNPFLGIRIIELLIFFINLMLLYRIAKRAALGNPLFHLLSFTILYLVAWDRGFLTETFSIPIVLTALWLLVKKAKYYEFICGTLLVLSFLLKQNAPAIIACIILLDIFTDFRQANKTRKAVGYIFAIALNSVLVFFILYNSSVWAEFLDQVFVYNITHESRPSLYDLVKNHLLHNNFLSIKGVSAIMVLNICILFMTIRYWLFYRKGYSFTMTDSMLSGLAFIYLFTYPFVYISGKSYPHYFMLLIVPATLIIGYYANKTIVTKLALTGLLIVGLNKNISAINFHKNSYQKTKEIVAFIQKNSREDELIHVVGLGNQYIYSMVNRRSNTKFLLPLFENNGYNESYKKTIIQDFKHPPSLLVFNKTSHWHPDVSDYYMQIINSVLKEYVPLFENELYKVFKLSKQRE